MKFKAVSLMVLLACSIVLWADDNVLVSAKALFYARVQPVQSPTSAPRKTATGKKTKLNKENEHTVTIPTKYALNTGLKYQLIQQLPDGTEAPVDPDTAFQSGDRIRLSFESNMKGYLYVVQQGSSGSWSMLFPDSRINGGKNTIDSGNQYIVPASGWFRFDENPGTEKLMVFLSQEPMDTFTGMTRSADASGVTVNQSVVDELNNIKSTGIRTRALVFEKDTASANAASRPAPAAYVVNKLGKAVVAEINLRHN